MRLHLALSRLLSIVLCLPVAMVLWGCGGEPELSMGDRLRERFPEQAAQVLGGSEAFIADGDRFVLPDVPREPSAWVMTGGGHHLKAELPRSGAGAIRFRSGGGFEVRVRQVDVTGDGVLHDHAVGYPRAGGTSFWKAVPGGMEEWLHLEAGDAQDGEAVAAWEIEGATASQRGDAVALLDEVGAARIWVTAPVAYAAGGRAIEATLVVRGARIELLVDAGGDEALVDPEWIAAGNMGTARQDHTATLLDNGQVLVAGGYNDGGLLASAELYNPATDEWTPTGSMGDARGFHTATLVNGMVLVVGGAGSLPTAELYDPGAGMWTWAGTLSTGRYLHTATLLGNGKVLVAGGRQDGVPLASAELYDPQNDLWTPAGSMTDARRLHTATPLGGGTLVLVAGGVNDNGLLAHAELYDPNGNTWSIATQLTPRWRHAATLLTNGDVLVTGGVGLDSFEVFDPMGMGMDVALMSTERYDHTATLLGNGKVLVAGGSADPKAELINPMTRTWEPAGELMTARSRHTATTLANGKVLVAGGAYNNVYLKSAELYLLLAGSPCSLATDCQSDYCADGVCCNKACNAGPCDACSQAAGADSDGTCKLLTGPACDDNNACTQTDTCQNGVCAGSNLVECMAPDQCHEPGHCNPDENTNENTNLYACSASRAPRSSSLAWAALGGLLALGIRRRPPPRRARRAQRTTPT